MPMPMPMPMPLSGLPRTVVALPVSGDSLHPTQDATQADHV
jgi:hypothetical protein